MASTPALSLVAATGGVLIVGTGSATGVVVEIGESLTRVTPVVDGFPLWHAMQVSKSVSK